MQRTHAVADAGQKPLFLAHEVADAAAEVLDGAVGEGDDQHLTIIKRSFSGQPFHQARGQQAQGEGLAAAGHGADAHGPVGVFKDCLLRGARDEVLAMEQLPSVFARVREELTRRTGVPVLCLQGDSWSRRITPIGALQQEISAFVNTVVVPRQGRRRRRRRKGAEPR